VAPWRRKFSRVNVLFICCCFVMWYINVIFIKYLLHMKLYWFRNLVQYFLSWGTPYMKYDATHMLTSLKNVNVLFICYGTAVERRSLLNRSGICDGINRCNICLFMSTLNVSIYSENRRVIYFSPQKRLKHGRQNITLHWINGIIRNNKPMKICVTN
jgi:hypothetical protein